MKFYLKILFNYLGFSNIPDDNIKTTKKTFLLKSFLFIYASKFIFFLAIFILRKMDIISIKNVGLTEWANDTNTYVFIFQVLIIAPVFEEILFRGILTGNKYLVSASISAFVFFSIKIFYYKNFYDMDDKFFYAITTALLNFMVLITFFRYSNIGSTLSKLYSSKIYMRFLIIISALFFAYWHSANFDSKNLFNLSLILAVLPHFISGIVFSGVCLNYGIFYSMLLHISVNLLPVFQTVIIK
jgi:uncharacterized protein